MQKHIIVAIFAILILAMVAIFALMLDFGNSINSFIPLTSETKQESVKRSLPPSTWSGKLAKVKTRDYHFPVNDLFIQIDIEKIKHKPKRKPKQTYQLLVDETNRYSLFCIRKTLENLSLPFIIVQDKKKNYIIIDSDEDKKLKEVVKRLKKYNINSKIKKVTI